MGQPRVSPDGRWWWDGMRWLPAGPAPRRWRQTPTIWTPALQIAVLALSVFDRLTFLVEALAVGAILRSIEAASLTTQLEARGYTPEQAAQVEVVTRSLVTVGFLAVGILQVLFLVFQTIATLRRWTWWYWVQFALYCQTLMALVLTLVQGGTAAGASTLALYSAFWPYTAMVALGTLASLALGVGLLIVGIRIGPWGMRRGPS